jgi:hypothetical protein
LILISQAGRVVKKINSSIVEWTCFTL